MYVYIKKRDCVYLCMTIATIYVILVHEHAIMYSWIHASGNQMHAYCPKPMHDFTNACIYWSICRSIHIFCLYMQRYVDMKHMYIYIYILYTYTQIIYIYIHIHIHMYIFQVSSFSLWLHQQTVQLTPFPREFREDFLSPGFAEMKSRCTRVSIGV